MSVGLSNAFYYMYSQILKANLKFYSLGASGQRNVTTLSKIIADPMLVQMIDTKAQVLDPALNELKEICMDSVVSYIQSLLFNFITAYIVFTVLLSLAVLVLVFVAFRILRKSMWDSNIILKIIPFETLPKADRIEIKDFFKS